MATGKERKQARADRYRERALQAKAGSTAAYRRSEELTKNIPSGQPILVGHHSEKRHRRALECSWNALGKSVELERKADYYAAKAEAAEHNRAIYAEDDDAVENLTERVAALESLQERMKAANRIIKNLKQTQEEKRRCAGSASKDGTPKSCSSRIVSDRSASPTLRSGTTGPISGG